MYLLPPGAGADDAPVIAPVKFSGTASAYSALSFSKALTHSGLRDTCKAAWS